MKIASKNQKVQHSNILFFYFNQFIKIIARPDKNLRR